MAALACSSNSSGNKLDEPLRNCSKQDEDNIRQLKSELFFDDDNNSNNSHSLASTQSLIRNLLLNVSSSVYETPWKASCEICKCLTTTTRNRKRKGSAAATSDADADSVPQQQSHDAENVLLVIVAAAADIQNFLLQTASMWLDEERSIKQNWDNNNNKNNNSKQSPPRTPPQQQQPSSSSSVSTTTTTPRYWILELMKIILQPLLWLEQEEGGGGGDCEEEEDTATTTDATTNANPSLLLEILLPTILSFCQDLFDTKLLHQCLNMIFPAPPSAMQQQKQQPTVTYRLLPWLNLVVSTSELHRVLRNEDWDCIIETIRGALIISSKKKIRKKKETTGDDDDDDDVIIIQPQDMTQLTETIFALSMLHGHQAKSSSSSSSSSNRITTSTNPANEEEGDWIIVWQEIIMGLMLLAMAMDEPEAMPEAETSADTRNGNNLPPPNKSILSNVESTFQTCLSTQMPHGLLQRWTQTFVSITTHPDNKNNDDEIINNIPNWLQVNMILLLNNALLLQQKQQCRMSSSKMIPKLVSRAFFGTHNGDGGGETTTTTTTTTTSTAGEVATGNKNQQQGDNNNNINLNEQCWKNLVSLALSPSSPIQQKRRKAKLLPPKKANNQSSSGDAATITITIAMGNYGCWQSVFKGVSYTEGGCFINKRTEKRIHLLSNAGKLVLESIYPHRNRKEVGQQQATATADEQRAQAWFNIVTESFTRAPSNKGHSHQQQNQYDHHQKSKIFAAVVIVTLYYEVSPKFRSTIIQRMVETFSMGGGEEMSQMHIAVISVLLLSSSSKPSANIELDQLSTVFTRQIPLSTFIDFSKTLSQLPSARKSLLITAEKYLHQHSLSWTSVASGAGQKDGIEQVKCSLYSLLVLIFSTKVWGDCETKAWVLLSDVIVTCKPSLPFSVRSWLFQQLSGYLLNTDNKGMNPAVSMHVLRACLCRLLFFFGTNQFGRKSFLPEKAFRAWGRSSPQEPVEDLVGLFQLVLALVSYHKPNGGNRSDMPPWRNYLRVLLQNQFGDIVSEPIQQDDEEMPGTTGLKMPFPTGSGRNRIHELHAALYCFSLTLQYVLARGETKDMVDIICPPTELIKKMLADQETKAFADSEPLPTWLKQQSPKHVIGRSKTSPSATSDSYSTNAVCFGLCNALVDFLLRGELTRVDGHDGEQSISKNDMRYMSLYVRSIFGVKKKLTLEAGQRNGRIWKGGDAMTLSKVFSAYCTVAVKTAQSLIVEADYRDFAIVDDILATVLILCDDVYAVPDIVLTNKNYDCFQSFAGTALKLLDGLCNEAASKRLITYLEKVVGRGSTVQAKIGLVGSHEEIDATIRSIRTDVVRVFVRCIPVLGRRIEPVTCNRTNGSCASAHTKSVQMLLTLIEGFAHDLVAGMEGESGGVSYELFDLFLNCIGLCTKSLDGQLSSSNELAQLSSAASLCTKIQDSVTDILCAYSLQGSVVLKKSLTLTLHGLPSLRRLVTRRAQVVQHKHLEIFKCWKLDSRSSVAYCLNQCSAILGRRDKQGLGYTAPWEFSYDGAEADSGTGTTAKSGDDDIYTEFNNKHRSKVVAPVPSSPGAQGSKMKNQLTANPDDERWLQLSSEQSWTWVYCNALQASEWTWEESLAVMQEKDLFCSSEGRDLYMKYRRGELTELMNGVSGLLDILTRKQDNEKDSANDNGNRALLTLPVSTKTRLLALLDRMFTVLQDAMKVVLTFVQQQTQEDQRTRNIGLAESLCCLNSWLNSADDKDDENNSSELTVAVRDWHQAEMAMMQRLRIPSTGVTSFSKKIPQTVSRAVELEGSLRSFLSELKDARKLFLKDKQKGTTNNAFSCIDHLLGAEGSHQNTTPSSSKKRGQGVIAVVSRKLRVIEDAVSYNDEEDDDSSLSESERNNNKKRRAAATSVETDGRRASVRKEKRRKQRHNVVRSRNQVVEKWLRKDQHIGQNEETFDNNDAYADLEDFLEPG